MLLKNPFIPLAFRLTVLAFSAAGVSIAAIIYEKVHRVNTDANQSNNCAPRASTYMAIIVGSVAIPYLGYVTWDEYMSKPYVLRKPKNSRSASMLTGTCPVSGSAPSPPRLFSFCAIFISSSLPHQISASPLIPCTITAGRATTNSSLPIPSPGRTIPATIIMSLLHAPITHQSAFTRKRSEEYY